ncbi:MAG: type II secretion system F family protein [Acidaminococcaceae bacterium]
MDLYRWRARNHRGEVFAGKMLAVNAREVAEYIKEQYGYVTLLEKTERQMNWRQWWPEQRRLTDVVLAEFFLQLATLLKSGLPLLQGLELMQGQTSGRMAEVCTLLAQELERGNSLATAMEKLGGDFTAASVQIVEAGEASGKLTELLQALASYYQRHNELKQFIKNACIYPCILVMLTLLVLGFFVGRVLPLFVELYAALAVEQTTTLKGLNFVGQMLDCYLREATSVFLLLVGVLYYRRQQLKRYCLALPVVKDCYHKMLESRYCRVLAMMLDSGIALPLALTAAATTLQAPPLVAVSAAVSTAVVRGVSLTRAAELNSELFSATSIEFIQIGEGSGQLVAMLLEAAKIIEQELQAKLKDVKALLEPLLLVVIALLVGAIIFLIASPMFELIKVMPEYN